MSKSNTYADKVSEAFKEYGVETPMFSTPYSNKEKIKMLENLFNDIHQVVGMNTSNDSIADTPERIAKLMINESMSGLDYYNFPKLTFVTNTFGNSPVILTDILVSSLCEHHWERVIMRVSIAYIPSKNVLGLSKFGRIAEFLGNRPIVQERYTQQLHLALKTLLETDDVAVHVRGIHMCMFARGVKEPCSNTTTVINTGKFETGDNLNMFLSSIDTTKPIIPN